ncbi:MAG: MBL fold metallo-hydrolase [Rickettsiales bacterium]|jgi:ribonuclease BN (tRNA processing enzyme)|nr:MBL fold metallo-hydrolase [Rickettsiales bacterium]
MKIQIIGSESAFDGLNTSFFFKDDADRGVLVDCGFTVYPEINRLGILQNVNVILISHLHSDHVGSLATTLMARKKAGHPIKVGGADISQFIKVVENRVDAYEVLPADDPLNIKTITTDHISGIMQNQALYIADKILYSGDVKDSLLDTDYAKDAKIILHEVALNTPIAHVKLEELAKADPAIKAKTWLIHIPVQEREEITRLATEYGFAGVCYNGQEIEI